MRIETLTIEDFCEELSAEAGLGRIFEDTVRIRVDRAAEQKEAITFEVGVWATALIRSEVGEWVLEFGRIAGSDTRAANTGSDTAAEWLQKINAVCDRHGLHQRKGKIEVY